MVIRLEQSFLRAKQKFDPMTKESNRRFKRSFEGIILCSTSRAGHPQLCMAESGDQSHTTQAAQIPRETATFTKIFFFFNLGNLALMEFTSLVTHMVKHLPIMLGKVNVKSLSRIRLFATPWTVAHEAPLSMGFSRQEHWSGLPFLPPGDLPDPGIEPVCPALTGGFFMAESPGKWGT